MKKRIALISTAAVLVIAAALFISSRPDAVIKITQADMEEATASNGGLITRDITVSKGDTIVVELYAAGNAGMRWSVTLSNPAVVKQDGAREFKGDGFFEFGGRHGEKWTFEALDSGSAVITMSYASVANLDPPPPIINRLIIQVTVN